MKVRGLTGVVLAVACLAGCAEEEPPNPFPPDALLRDSLGLRPEDRVHTVRLDGGGNVEVADPAVTTVRPGDWVEFRTLDGRVHTVRFETDGVSREQAAYLQRSQQVSSPPLIERDSRFVVSFGEAPAGRYPFVVEGNGAPGRGVIVVEVAAGGS